MSDPFLFELLHRVSSPLETVQSSNRFSIAFEKAVKREVEKQLAEQIEENKFLSRENLRQKIEEEVRRASDLSEFGAYITSAVRIFRHEGIRYLDEEQNRILLEGLSELGKKIDQLDLENLTDQSLYEAFEVLNPSVEAVLKMGIAKYEEDLYQDSLALFTFLTLIEAGEPDYWFRMGLVAEKDNKIDLALRAFEVAEDLNPGLAGPHIYAAECLLLKGLKQEARREVEEAKNCINQSETAWGEEVAAIEDLLTSPDSVKES